MSNIISKPVNNDVGGFLLEELVKPVFDKRYKDKPIEKRWKAYKERTTGKISNPIVFF